MALLQGDLVRVQKRDIAGDKDGIVAVLLLAVEACRLCSEVPGLLDTGLIASLVFFDAQGQVSELKVLCFQPINQLIAVSP